MILIKSITYNFEKRRLSGRTPGQSNIACLARLELMHAVKVDRLRNEMKQLVNSLINRVIAGKKMLEELYLRKVNLDKQEPT